MFLEKYLASYKFNNIVSTLTNELISSSTRRVQQYKYPVLKVKDPTKTYFRGPIWAPEISLDGFWVSWTFSGAGWGKGLPEGHQGLRGAASPSSPPSNSF